MWNVIFSIVMICSLAIPAFAADEKPAQPRFPVEHLNEGGYTIFMRHTKRDDVPSQAKLNEIDRTSSCEPGGSLNSEGEAESRVIAQAIKSLAIPAGEVLASPTCRTKQMARIIFGDDFKIENVLAPDSVRDASQSAEDAAALKALLTRPVPAGTNRFLISHGKLMTAKTVGMDVPLEQSQAAVFRSDAQGGFEFLGIIKPEEWGNN